MLIVCSSEAVPYLPLYQTDQTARLSPTPGAWLGIFPQASNFPVTGSELPRCNDGAAAGIVNQILIWKGDSVAFEYAVKLLHDRYTMLEVYY